MGAFFLYHKNSIIAEPSVKELYALKGFKNSFRITIGVYNLILYKKQIIDVVNHFQIKENYIFVTGSLFYKGLSYTQTLKSLLSDFVNNCIDPQNLYGNYVIIFYNSIQNQVTFCIDPAFIKNVYYDTYKKIITSDFLALINSSPGSYSLNQLAIVENMTTGHLISPDTYANEIQKLDRLNIKELGSGFPGIIFRNFSPDINCNGILNSYDDAIKHANNQLFEYFGAVKELTEEYGAHIGLTGGFDSRLLLMHARKHLSRLVTNSFWRNNSQEYINAKNLAKAANLNFFSFEKSPFIKPEKEVMLKNSYYFFDGQIRSQNNWDEEFNNPSYTSQLAFNHYVGFHGCGGEQYRNADRLIGKIRFKTFIKHEWMFKQCENVFTDKELQFSVYNNILRKIRRQIDINKNRIGLTDLKRIQNEIYVSANKSMRVNVLNQQQFYFAPFTEYQISQTAYSLIPYLGNSLNFQVDMMKNADTELTALKTNYGFDILKGEPLANRFIPYLINIIPKSVFYMAYYRWKNFQTNNFKENEFLKSAHPFLIDLKKKVNFNKLGQNINLGKSLSSFNTLLKNLQPK